MTESLTVLVCGGRDYANADHVFDVLDRLHRERGIARLVCGGATGADAKAAQWAYSRRVSVGYYPADWHTHGRAAGPIRNRQMLEAERPELVIAFPGGRGTADMTRRAELAGVPVQFHEEPAELV